MKRNIFFFLFKDNLAFNKPTWQKQDFISSENAVDGLFTNLSVNNIDDHCARSFQSTDITWLVDLEALNSISKIVIHHEWNGEFFGKFSTPVLIWLKTLSLRLCIIDVNVQVCIVSILLTNVSILLTSRFFFSYCI